MAAYWRQPDQCFRMINTAAIIGATVFAAAVTGSTTACGDVDFVREIRPILAEKCFACHGPDEQARQVGLRFDVRTAATGQLQSGSIAIVPGDPTASELIRRIHSSDPEQLMPPPEHEKPLTAAERDILQRWISEGAEYQQHWAFQPVQVPEVPASTFDSWDRNRIDRFVGSRLREAGFDPSPEADRTALIRRLSFDLRGLPPTVAEVDAFLADQSADAYERLVQRFLESPHFGEKLAIFWLDLARYGDTNGYHNDSHREIWLYRDWVIDAFNSNMPFDRFAREQIAGDLMPRATESQRVASGFHRNAPFNEEGGVDPEEFRVAYAVDRANTTGQAFLGLTIGCAQCHSHKYDPISHQEYYEFLAFFNSVAGEPGGGGENGHHGIPVPPTMKASSPLREREAGRLTTELEVRQERLAERMRQAVLNRDDLRAELLNWVHTVAQQGVQKTLTVDDGLVLRLDATDVDADGIPDVEQFPEMTRQVSTWIDHSDYRRTAKATGQPQWIRDGFPGGSPAVSLDGKSDFFRTPQGGEFLRDGYTIVAAVSFGAATHHQMLVMWGDEAQGKRRAFWRTAGDRATLSFNGYAADVVGNQLLASGSSAVGFVSQPAGGSQVALELNGQAGGQGSPMLAAYTNQAITIGANNAGLENCDARIAEILVYDRELSGDQRADVGAWLSGKYSIETQYRSIPIDLAAIAAVDHEIWSNAEWQRMLQHYLLRVNGAAAIDLRDELLAVAALAEKIRQLQQQHSTMVMQEMAERNPAFVLARGDFLQPGKEVFPNVPAVLGRLPEDRLQSRLDLANWLTSSENPLVARVRVNHLWKMLFGTGLVRTAGDLGTQGEFPSHPQLLDWLAGQFVSSGWDTKQLIHLIVTSATYRQQSVVRASFAEQDPANRLLSRAPRFRLTAEEIRDMALFSSGRLNPEIGGPGVRPFQPANYFAANSGKAWPEDRGRKAQRRALYTYLQRTAPFPALLIFDAPSRQICTASRPRTNTPLQALALMNDPLFVQAGGALAACSVKSGQSAAEQVQFVFRAVLSRPPTADEEQLLLQIQREQLAVYERDLDAANALLQAADVSSDGMAGHSAAEVAAWTNLACVVLNLDEAITRE